MNTNQSKHISNFVLTMRKELIDNRKGIMIGIGSCWGLCMLLGGFLGIFNLGGGTNEVFFFLFLFSIISGIAGSLTFSNMKTKEGRISAILLPSTAFDKFLVRWLAVVPGLMLVFIIGFYIGDISRIILSMITQSEMGSNYYHIVNVWQIAYNIFEKSNLTFLFSALIICGYFFSQALYIFGSILWPKLSYIKTLLALWALQMVFGSIGMILVKIIGRPYMSWSEEQVIAFLWNVAGVIVILTIIIYYLTYLRFKRCQVVYKLF